MHIPPSPTPRLCVPGWPKSSNSNIKWKVSMQARESSRRGEGEARERRGRGESRDARRVERCESREAKERVRVSEGKVGVRQVEGIQ